ncbi:hypothetical protein LZ31DRAFT_279064 [Colletotrichum somersetense]|nr:hypothetical protein LZ31DRAFT_279064 [Colletotrichum somersetense]
MHTIYKRFSCWGAMQCQRDRNWRNVPNRKKRTRLQKSQGEGGWSTNPQMQLRQPWVVIKRHVNIPVIAPAMFTGRDRPTFSYSSPGQSPRFPEPVFLWDGMRILGGRFRSSSGVPPPPLNHTRSLTERGKLAGLDKDPDVPGWGLCPASPPSPKSLHRFRLCCKFGRDPWLTAGAVENVIHDRGAPDKNAGAHRLSDRFPIILGCPPGTFSPSTVAC